jgi:hypothetical protein
MITVAIYLPRDWYREFLDLRRGVIVLTSNLILSRGHYCSRFPICGQVEMAQLVLRVSISQRIRDIIMNKP